METVSELFMQRALDLASRGGRDVMPNPQVGCVIVYDWKIIGEGWHKKYGEAHAEVNAVNSVKDTELLKKAVMYVTLEPCSHFGKTPPCADMIVKLGIPKIVIASSDPNPIVSGDGIKKLREAGIEVVPGILNEENRDLNRRFFTFHEKKRPYVILKWAQSADGFIDKIRKVPDEPPQWITDEYCRTLVHKWRAREQAILAGARTIVMDNPKLNVRNWSGIDPVRIVIAGKTKFKNDCNIFDGKARTFILTSDNEFPDYKNAEIFKIENISASAILGKLYELGFQSVFIEGGARMLTTFINEDLWDEARVFTGPVLFKNGVVSPYIQENKSITKNINDIILKYYFK